MTISSDYIKSLIAEEFDPKKREVYALALTCFPLLNAKTVLNLRSMQEAMDGTSVTVQDRNSASGLDMLLTRAEEQNRLIKGVGNVKKD